MVSEVLLRYKSGGRVAAGVKVFKNLPNSEYLSANVPKSISDVLRSGFIYDRKAKDFDAEEISGSWNSQGYPTMMIPANEELWLSRFCDPQTLDVCEPGDEQLISVSGYIGFIADKRRTDFDEAGYDEEDAQNGEKMKTMPVESIRRVKRGSAPSFRLWRFLLLTRGLLKRIMRFRRDKRQVLKGSTKPRLDLKAKDFEDCAPFSFVIALPSSESALTSLHMVTEESFSQASGSLCNPERCKRPRGPQDTIQVGAEGSFTSSSPTHSICILGEDVMVNNSIAVSASEMSEYLTPEHEPNLVMQSGSPQGSVSTPPQPSPDKDLEPSSEVTMSEGRDYCFQTTAFEGFQTNDFTFGDWIPFPKNYRYDGEDAEGMPASQLQASSGVCW